MILTTKKLERTLPTNIQAEQMLLGAVLINPNLIEQVSEFLRVEHFFEILHQKIYNSIEIILEKKLTPSIITLKSMLDKDPLFIELNGKEYLIKLTTMAIVVINPQDYGKIIFDLAIKRNLIKIGEETVNIAYDSTLELSGREQLETAEIKLYNLASEGGNEKSFLHIREHVDLSLDSINKAMKNSDHVTGISTGLNDLDKKLSGFHNSDMVIIAGRPGMGKTAFAINFAFNACKALLKKAGEGEVKPSVGFFSLEMSSEQLSTRLLSMLTKVDSTLLRNGKVNEENYNSIRRAAQELKGMQIFIDDSPALTISSVRTRARKLKRKHNLGIIFIDYLQLLRGSNRSENRVVEVSEITQGLKALAKELNIPVVALAQLSRAVEQRDDKRPMLSDLRESGSIEQDADVVMFLYREEYYLRRREPKQDDPKYSDWADKLGKVHNFAEILIAKHRNGAVGNVAVYYEDKYSTVSNLDSIH